MANEDESRCGVEAVGEEEESEQVCEGGGETLVLLGGGPELRPRFRIGMSKEPIEGVRRMELANLLPANGEVVGPHG